MRPNLGSQINLKIEDFRKQKRKEKMAQQKKVDLNFIEDVYYQGFVYVEFLKCEKEMKISEEKEKIRNDIQTRKAKLTDRCNAPSAGYNSGFGTKRGRNNDCQPPMKPSLARQSSQKKIEKQPQFLRKNSAHSFKTMGLISSNISQSSAYQQAL
mgnify:CR=1 FL=1